MKISKKLDAGKYTFSGEGSFTWWASSWSIDLVYSYKKALNFDYKSWSGSYLRSISWSEWLENSFFRRL